MGWTGKGLGLGCPCDYCVRENAYVDRDDGRELGTYEVGGSVWWCRCRLPLSG